MDKLLPGFLKKYRRKHKRAGDRHRNDPEEKTKRHLPKFLKIFRRKHNDGDGNEVDPNEKTKTCLPNFLKNIRRKHHNTDKRRSEKGSKSHKPSLRDNWVDLLSNPVDLFNLLAFPVPSRSTHRTRASLDNHTRRNVLEGHDNVLEAHANWVDLLSNPVELFNLLAFPVPSRPTHRTRASLDHHTNGRRDVLKGHASHENLDDLLADPVPTRPTSRTRTQVDYHTNTGRVVLKEDVPRGNLLADLVPTRTSSRTGTSVEHHSNGSTVKNGTKSHQDMERYERRVLPCGCTQESPNQSNLEVRRTNTYGQSPLRQYDLSASSSKRQARSTVVQSTNQSNLEVRRTNTYGQSPLRQYDLSASSSKRQANSTVVQSTNQSNLEVRSTTPSRQLYLPQYDDSASIEQDGYESDESYYFGLRYVMSESAKELELRSKGEDLFCYKEYTSLIVQPFQNNHFGFGSSDSIDSYSDSSITDIGKWLENISIEPRFGCMIKKGYEMGFVYDTIVFTALCSFTGSIFYRGGDDQQKKESDLKKLIFCDSKGDAFTYLKIYKEWEQVPKRQKNEWCFDNSLNSKSLRGARELVNEICSILKQNGSIEVKRQFSTELELQEALQKIILFAFYENIAHSLGHIRMGYYIPNLQQRVFIHPSSALNSLNDSSQWLVFINILKTSRDYITVLTPVEESWIRWATRLKTKQFDINEAKRNSVCSVRNQFFGSTTYSIFVGPAHTKLKAYEDLLYEYVQVPVVIEADKKTGEVKFICGYNATLPDDLIDDWIAEAKNNVIQKSAEYNVGSNNQAGGVRIVLGLGGEGQLILMPDEYRTVHIKSWNKETSKETVEDKFKRFGHIVDCWEDKRSYHGWGHVTFSTPAAAAEAVRHTHDDPRDAAAPEFKIQKHASFQYKAIIEWMRRKPTGLVFVEMDYMEAMAVKSLREVRILGQSCGISLDRKTRNTVLLHRVPTMVTEQDIHLCFPHHSQRQAITKISIIRQKTFTNPNELPNFRQQIHDQFREFDHDMKFVVDVMKPYHGNINFRAFIKFNDVSQGTMACDALQGRLTINGQKAKITQQLSTSLSVPEHVYQLLKDEIEDFVSESEENGAEFELDIKNLNNGRCVLNISALYSNDLVQIRMGLAAITQGEVIECWRNENNRYLFLKSGREFLRRLEKKTNTILQLDNRLLSLKVFGIEHNISVALDAIGQYLGNMAKGDGRREIKLNGESQPKGLLKTLVTRYDLELEGFVQASGLQSALLNHRNQTLKICGDSVSIEKATGLIESLAAKLRNKTTKSGMEELPDCCTCFCPVESMDQMYRLEACGHLYCLDCIKRQITVAVEDKELPVLCGKCRDPLVWSDFQFCFSRLEMNPLDLVRTAVSVYMTKNKDGYHHCLTPDCPMVYRITKKSDIFNCNECGLRICSSCHVEYHDGLTCAMLKSSGKVESEMEKYLRENAKRVKKCPKCSTPIEKIEGCHHMICKACKIHFCWLCCASFQTYNNMSRYHNCH